VGSQLGLELLLGLEGSAQPGIELEGIGLLERSEQGGEPGIRRRPAHI
jgi:hypothetical protein